MDSHEDVSHSVFLMFFTTVTLLNPTVYIHRTSCVSTDMKGNAFTTSVSVIFSVTSWQKIGEYWCVMSIIPAPKQSRRPAR